MSKTVLLENIMKLLPCEVNTNNSNMKETVFTVACYVVYTLIMSSVPLKHGDSFLDYAGETCH